MFKSTTTAALLLSTLLAAGAHAAGPSGTSADFGAAVSGNASHRTITVKPDTKWINVTNGETVTIAAGGKAFSWHVDTFPNRHVFDLAKIAPQDDQAPNVRVYVEPNPLYLGN